MRLYPDAPRRQRAEAVVPMINVVFLLLIFFLMTAQIDPPDPFGVDLPESALGSEAAPEAGAGVVHLGPDGALAHEGAEGEAALAALRAGEGPVTLRADARAPAARLAEVLSALVEAGRGPVELAVWPREGLDATVD